MAIRLRLLFFAIDYALCVALATFWLVVAVTNGEWRLVGSLLAAVWMTFAVWISRDFARTLAAWRRGEPCRPVSRIEWGILIWQLLGALVIVCAWWRERLCPQLEHRPSRLVGV